MLECEAGMGFRALNTLAIGDFQASYRGREGDSIVLLGSSLPDHCDSGGDLRFWCDSGNRSLDCQGLVHRILNHASALANIRVARTALELDVKRKEAKKKLEKGRRSKKMLVEDESMMAYPFNHHAGQGTGNDMDSFSDWRVRMTMDKEKIKDIGKKTSEKVEDAGKDLEKAGKDAKAAVAKAGREVKQSARKVKREANE